MFNEECADQKFLRQVMVSKIIIMYIYYVLINALSTHMIHINLNMILYTHVERSPTKIIYIKYYTEKQTLPGHALHTHTQLFLVVVVL